MSLSTLAICCAVGLLSHPFNSFTIISWNQPASFLATFARRRIENVGQFFQKELPEFDSFNTRQYYWFYASIKAWGVGMLYRGIVMWTASGGYSLSPTLPGWIQSSISYVKKMISSSSNKSNNKNENQQKEEAAQNNLRPDFTQSRAFEDAREEILLKTEADKIFGYTLNFSTGSLVRSTFRATLSAVTAILTSPLNIVLVIFVADISNGYPTLARAWKGLKASAACDWDREHPPYKPGMDPWKKIPDRPGFAHLIFSKLSKHRVFTEALLPFAKYAVAHSLVSSFVQFFESWMQRRRFSQRLLDQDVVEGDNENDNNNNNNRSKRDRVLDQLAGEQVTGTTSTLLFLSHLTSAQKFKKILSNSGHFFRIFIVSGLMHGLVSYNMSQELSTAVQNTVRMTDYSSPYDCPGGRASVSNPLQLRVPKISLFFGISDGVCWGIVTSLVAMWR